jgi:hypothetical protein
MNNSNVIVNGLVILGKITAIFFIIGGIIAGLGLIMYSFVSKQFNGEKTMAIVDKDNIKCSQQVNFRMKPEILCDVPLKYNVDGKEMTTTLNSIPNDMINPNYPIKIEYNRKKPDNVSLIMFDKKNSSSNMIMGILIIILVIYLGNWLYNNDSLSSILGIGQLGSFIVGV